MNNNIKDVFDCFIKSNQKNKEVYDSFIADLFRADFSEEEAHYIVDGIENLLSTINQKRNFGNIFTKPIEVPHILS